MAFDYSTFGMREGTGSGGVEPDGRVYTIDPLGFKVYPKDMQPLSVRNQHVAGQGGSLLHDYWSWDQQAGKWVQPMNPITKHALINAGIFGGGVALDAASPALVTAASGHGIGETGATTGLGGSGFAGSASAPGFGGATVAANGAWTPLTGAGSAAGVTAAETARNVATAGGPSVFQRILGPLLGIGGAVASHVLAPTHANAGTANAAGLTPEMQQIVTEAFRRNQATTPLFNDVVSKVAAGMPRR